MKMLYLWPLVNLAENLGRAEVHPPFSACTSACNCITVMMTPFGSLLIVKTICPDQMCQAAIQYLVAEEQYIGPETIPDKVDWTIKTLRLA